MQSLTILLIAGLPQIRLVDILDIIIVAFLLYQLYKMVKGTNVIRIFWAILVIYLAYYIVSAADMRLSTEILKQFINIGLVALIIIFQPEIRRFLLLVGTKSFLGGDNMRKRFSIWKRNLNSEKKNMVNFEPYVQSCIHMSQSKTGALMIFMRENDLSDIIASGERVDAKASPALIEALFFKNSPLHDGAVMVKGNTIVSARCILPVSSNHDIDPNLGLRHRSAIGITEDTDAIAVIVSEETGAISYAVGGEIHHDVSPEELKEYLEQHVS